MSLNNQSNWKESEYIQYLHHERHMFAWCFVAYGKSSEDDAKKLAEEFYYYEPADVGELRGLVFHDEAWHWAMLKIFGGQYWIKFPHLESVPTDYRIESARYDDQQLKKG